MLTDLKISCGITFVVRRSNFSALSDFEIITLVPDAPDQTPNKMSGKLIRD